MRSQPRLCAVRSLVLSLSFSLPLTLSGSARPLDLVDADRSRSVYNARRGARPWPPPPIYSGRSDGRTNLGTSTNPYCAARTRESRIVLGPVSLPSFFSGVGRADRRVGSEQGSATKEMRKSKARERGVITKKKTEAGEESPRGLDSNVRGRREYKSWKAIVCIAPYALRVGWREKTWEKERKGLVRFLGYKGDRGRRKRERERGG